jgi:excisionase family DNA binding protein
MSAKLDVRVDDHLLRTDQAAKLLGLSGRYLEILRVRGGGPAFASFGRAVRYRRADINAWLETRLRRSTSEQLHPGDRSASLPGGEPMRRHAEKTTV